MRTPDLPTLKFRRLRGDMIETYEVLSGIYDTSVSPAEIHIISEYATRGNSLKIANRRCRYNLRKYSFSMIITKLLIHCIIVDKETINRIRNNFINSIKC